MEMEVDNSLADEFRTLVQQDTEFSKRCSRLAYDIQQGSSTIVQLVEQLKSLLIDSSPENRQTGMRILSQVLQLLPKEHFAATQLNFIFAFYSDRLNDHHQVIPTVLNGILALVNFENVPEGATRQILASLFQNVPCQQQQQADRYTIYKILEACLEKRNSELQQMGFDFIYGVISAMDGERDPRNLLFLFKWLSKFLKSFTLGHLTEEMFEVMACYFPVDFRAPSQDSDSISRESLAEALCPCLCAVPEFAEYCLPLVLEKLTSTLRIAKLDSLCILAEGCKTFELSVYIQHSTDIWSQLQREVLNCTDEELGETCLKTLEMVIRKLSQSSDDIFKRILSDITDTLKGNLLPHLKLFTPSCKFLNHVAKASKASAIYITSEIVPLLINTYNITTTKSHQVLIFINLINFVKVHIDVHQNDNIVVVGELTLVPNLCLKAALDPEDEMRATGFSSLALIAKSLPFDTRKCFYENLCLLMIMPQSNIVRRSLLECFKTMAQTYSDELKNFVLNNVKINDNEALELYLDTLVAIVDQEDFTEVVLPIFINHCEKDVDRVHIATGCLRKLLEVHGNHQQIQSFLVEKARAVNKLVDWVLNNLNAIGTSAHKYKLLENVAAICKLIIGYQNSNTQSNIINSKLENVIDLYRSKRNCILFAVFDGLLTRLRPDVRIKYDVVDDLFEVALTSDENYIQQVALQLLANILNKCTDNEKLEADLNKIVARCNGLLSDGNTDERIIENVIRIISWITKALVMREHEQAKFWTNKLLDLLKMHESAARSFKIIMNDDCTSLNQFSYCNKRLLYRQKFFIEVSNRLNENYQDENSNYLLAIGYLLQEAPRQVFILQFNKILRLVVLCLEKCNDTEVLCAVLDTLCSLIKNRESLIEEHLQEFLPRFLKLSMFTASMQVRIKALQCIQNYTEGYPLYKLLPHKQDVIRGLSRCLDDNKRLVRKEAVGARLRWYMLDAPT